MNYDSKRIAGLLFFVAVVQYILAVVISEAVYSGYSVQQYMSDLGNWSLAGINAAIFNASAVLFGMFIIAAAYFIQRVFKNRLFTSLPAISGACDAGAGIFAEDISLTVHSVFALVAFLVGAAAVIMSL